MFVHRRFGAASALTAALTLAAAGSAAARQPAQGATAAGAPGAVFVQTDALAGNAIAVYDRASDGTLTPAGTYPTGGDGGRLGGSAVDHLASQDSLAYDAAAGELFAVNAGSDSVSVFGVEGDQLQLRQVIGSGGSFPASLSVHGDLVYVLNSADGGQIQGFRLTADGRLRSIPGSGRGLGLSVAVPPQLQFVNTPGDIAFSPDGQQLIVTTKANTDAIDVFGIDPSGRLSATPTVNSEPGTVPFALAFTTPGVVDVANAATSTVTSFQLQGDGELTALSTVATGQLATCWLVADGSTLFAGNAASSSESSILTGPGGSLALAATTSTDAGTVDAATSPDGRYLYVQTGAAGIVDEYSVGAGGSLSRIGSVSVPNAVGGEGIATA
ncbi:MAG TPA: beta-propeller fold lactonase family protein [Solirubrobacteraceae bacterium]|nr:beta-propeller fold lactonase family protein [Solirubrobacteraceae bacterium]